jgi:toluene monooxygenase system ferredoxin subunit
MGFRELMPLEELWVGEMTRLVVMGRRVLLVRTDDGVFAYDDRCPHLGAALSEGTLEGHVLTCSAHHFSYDVRSGRGINPHNVCLRRFPTQLAAGAIWADVDADGVPTEGLTR